MIIYPRINLYKVQKAIIDYLRITTVEKVLFNAYDLNEGMFGYDSKVGKTSFIVNTNLKMAFKIVNFSNHLRIKDEDIDSEKVKKKFEEQRISDFSNFSDKSAQFGFWCIEGFKNGLCLLRWEFYPDGLYFADEDGFGRKMNDAVELYALISDKGGIVVPFQPAEGTDDEIFESLSNMIDLYKRPDYAWSLLL